MIIQVTHIYNTYPSSVLEKNLCLERFFLVSDCNAALTKSRAAAHKYKQATQTHAQRGCYCSSLTSNHHLRLFRMISIEGHDARLPYLPAPTRADNLPASNNIIIRVNQLHIKASTCFAGEILYATSRLETPCNACIRWRVLARTGAV